MTDLSTLLSDLVIAGQRLTRLAVSETGERTSPLTFLTLSALTDHGPMRTGDLAAHGRVTQPAMTRLLATLADQGWVRRVADADARASRFEVTEEGIAMQKQWHRRLGDALEPRFQALSDEDIQALARAVAVVNAQLDHSVS
ncbi:MarR family transcriptional regulator [Gordonia sp. ABSL1-1]|uniref:MarR family winged helix-turn-helix transcriptional regulator n=1 Tax=Gordonia sp. ABSL1-1 TaxID=3053923 RepID=UPI002572340B|nr:MarR family transcriptional regulator [Gordonia sp. ABSL1-1]MDL9935741.1 MarR family transcriptional regulator [Gordonia sp. ABSL1-1]